jgi:hypothetical protein
MSLAQRLIFRSLDSATRPKAVGPSWVQACVKSNLRLKEETYAVDMDDYKPSAKDKYKVRLSFSLYVPEFELYLATYILQRQNRR